MDFNDFLKDMGLDGMFSQEKIEKSKILAEIVVKEMSIISRKFTGIPVEPDSQYCQGTSHEKCEYSFQCKKTVLIRRWIRRNILKGPPYEIYNALIQLDFLSRILLANSNEEISEVIEKQEPRLAEKRDLFENF